MPQTGEFASCGTASEVVDPPSKPLPEPRLPESLGPFLLGRRIGEGGSAVVHEASREGDVGRYAVKTMRPGARHGTSAFEIERVVLSSITHPNIVRLVDHGVTDEGLHWIATRFIRGWSLRTVLDHSADVPADLRPDLLRSVLLPLLLGICDAVHHAHDHAIVHCDLKPSNVVVTPEKRAWLIDWGMARTFNPGAPPPEAIVDRVSRERRSVGGTPGYMSPEQIGGGTDSLGPWSDVWSLGAMLYELITGQRAYRRAPAKRVLQATLANPPTRPHLRRPLPDDLDQAAWLCTKAMDPTPARRPASAAELAASVAASLEG